MDAEVRTFDLQSTLKYRVAEPATFVLNVAAMRAARQRVRSESLSLTPEVEIEEYREPETRNRYHRFVAPKGRLTVHYAARVEAGPRLSDARRIVARPPDALPLATLRYLYPSRFCQSDELMRLAGHLFGDMEPGYAQVSAICDWIRDSIEYVPGSTGPLISAYDTAIQRIGVCRDFAHLAIAFCRALSIPARFVSGYADELPLPDFHSCFDAWLGERWYTFDPTGQASPDRLVRVGTGRDAADVAFAHIFGPAEMTEIGVSCRTVRGKGRKAGRRERAGGDRAYAVTFSG